VAIDPAQAGGGYSLGGSFSVVLYFVGGNHLRYQDEL